MRITHYRHMTDDELLKFAHTRAETPLEVELLNRLEDGIETLRRQVVVLRECVEEIAYSTPSDDAERAAREFLEKFDREFT